MKMAENSVLTFNNNCASNNRICAEVNGHIRTTNKDENSDITDPININNSQSDKLPDSSDVCTQEEAAEEFLAGENKSECENESNFSDGTDELLEEENPSQAPECELQGDTDQKSEDEESTMDSKHNDTLTWQPDDTKNANW